MMKLPEDEFKAEIARRFGAHLGATKAAGPRWSYPLKFHLARGYVRPRFALAGDSAHGIHPIAGQGLNLGLKDAAALAEIVLDAARLGPGHRQRRRSQALRALAALRFASRSLRRPTAEPAVLQRHRAAARWCAISAWGSSTRIGPARRFFMRHAGGDVGKLPRLMKGEAA